MGRRRGGADDRVGNPRALAVVAVACHLGRGWLAAGSSVAGDSRGDGVSARWAGKIGALRPPDGTAPGRHRLDHDGDYGALKRVAHPSFLIHSCRSSEWRGQVIRPRGLVKPKVNENVLPRQIAERHFSLDAALEVARK